MGLGNEACDLECDWVEGSRAGPLPACNEAPASRSLAVEFPDRHQRSRLCRGHAGCSNGERRGGDVFWRGPMTIAISTRLVFY